MTRVRGLGVPMAMALIALSSFATGCGQAQHTRVLTPHFVQRSDLERYPADSPARASLELLRALQFNDPGAAATFFTGSLRPTPEQIREFLAGYRPAALGAGVPRILRVVRSGSGATVFAPVLQWSAVLSFQRLRGTWKLAHYRVGGFIGPSARTAPRRPPARPPPPPRLVQRSDIERYRAGTPARAALEAIGALQHGQATAVARLVTPSWRLTPQKAALYSLVIKAFGVPKVTAVMRRGGRATVTLRVGRVPLFLDFVRASGRWKLARARVGALRLPAGS